MASIGHVAFGLAAGRFEAAGKPPLGPMLVLSALALLPDADVLAFKLRIAYPAPWGHRGAAHSLLVAALVAALCALFARRLGRTTLRTFGLTFAVLASHGLLDALTDGGLGVALLWPFTARRFFFPWTPIPVAPIGAGFVSWRGLQVALTELVYFLPLFLFALWPRKRIAQTLSPRSRSA